MKRLLTHLSLCVPALLYLLTFTPVLDAQTYISLPDYISLAKTQSAMAEQAKNNYYIATYDYKLYRKSLLPTLTLSGNLPALNRTISKITLPDGKEAFVAQYTGNYSASLSLNQPVPFTGGIFYVSSGLQRLDIYQDSTTTSYLGNIINVGIRQPVISYNQYKWQKKIEPVAYKKAQRSYAETLEEATKQAVELYFNLLATQTSLQLARQNKDNSDTLLLIAQERFALGKITEDEKLEVEISNLNLTIQIEELLNTLQEQQAALVDFAGLPASESLILMLPEPLAVKHIAQEKAYQEAASNGTLSLEHQQRLLEAQSDLARVKADNGFSIDLSASFGLSKNDEAFGKIYRNPLNQEQITLSFNIPIVDWGVARFKRKKAQLALSNVSSNIDKEKLDFLRSINSTVNQYNIQTAQLQLVNKSQELTAKRFEMSREHYISGKINFLEYSIAQNEKDNSKITYIKTLQNCWTKYYEIRKQTLYDFQEKKNIINDIAE
jgi:outer membrane protein TolC